MEKTAANNHKLRNKILKLLPKVVSLRNIGPFSPRRDNRPDVNAQRFRTHQNRAFSGPMVSMIPAEARRKPKNFETQEPSSPKVSCMGQVKHKSKISEKKHVSLPKEIKPVPILEPSKSDRAGPKILRGGRKSDKPADRADPDCGSAPALSQMRKFASSRETFANFDWTTAAQIAPEEGDRGFYSDEEGAYSDGEDGCGGIPFSAPILMGGGGGVGGLDLEPRKEINLWKRRTMAPPKSLQLNLDREY
ncbi:hypothetical protein C2S52_011464 [Perilla frutescens var. hirtella]|nr:hypothetical protein C2S52_011464 [Perilla frutescens var. hirtella]KAH6785882.1 hypothetical protein C2S51_038337 [Perilla frutescens var. frutescens]